MTGTTGPKTSSRMIRIEWSTPVMTTGAMNLPPPGPRPRPAPPVRTSAPFATASSSSSTTLSYCISLFIGPIWVVGLRAGRPGGWPGPGRSGAQRTRRRSGGRRRRARSPAHVWPALAKPAHIVPATARPMSASARTTAASLPPELEHHRLQLLRGGLHDLASRRGAAREEDLLHRPRPRRWRRPTSPRPCRTRRTPRGRPAASNARAISFAMSGVYSLGFSRTPLPAARARADLAGRDRERVVPRGDDPDDAERARTRSSGA